MYVHLQEFYTFHVINNYIVSIFIELNTKLILILRIMYFYSSRLVIIECNIL